MPQSFLNLGGKGTPHIQAPFGAAGNRAYGGKGGANLAAFDPRRRLMDQAQAAQPQITPSAPQPSFLHPHPIFYNPYSGIPGYEEYQHPLLKWRGDVAPKFFSGIATAGPGEPQPEYDVQGRKAGDVPGQNPPDIPGNVALQSYLNQTGFPSRDRARQIYEASQRLGGGVPGRNRGQGQDISTSADLIKRLLRERLQSQGGGNY